MGPMTKGALIKAIAGEFEIKTKQASKVINSIAGIASHEVASIGKFTLPGVFRIKSRQKPATKATKRGLRQDVPREGPPGTHDCESLPRGSFEEVRLRLHAVRTAHQFLVGICGINGGAQT